MAYPKRRVYRRRTVGMMKRKSYGAKRTKRTYGRKTYGRRRGLYEKGSVYTHPASHLRCLLTTGGVVNVAPGTATYTTQIAPFSGSDPFLTLGTQQPRGWDKLATDYAKYVIDKGYINLTFNNETTNAVSVILYRSTSSAAPSSYQEARQWEGAKEKVVQAAGGSRTYVSFKFPFNSRYASYGNNDDKSEWADTTETGASATSRLGVIGIYMTSLKSSSAANITGVMNMRIIQSARFASLSGTDTIDTTAD